MMVRLTLAATAAALALSTAACSSLTKPDEIQIVAEPAAPAGAPAGHQAPAVVQGAAVRPTPAPAPQPQGGNCGG